MSIFFLLGAGASVDSGLKTYRGTNGMYNNTREYEKLLSAHSFTSDEQFIKMWKLLQQLYVSVRQNVPGPTYTIIQQLVNEYPNSYMLTQNVDSYATTLSNVDVTELHGSHKTVKCVTCGTVSNTPEIIFDGDHVINMTDVKCGCGGKLASNILLFGQSLSSKDTQTLNINIKHSRPKYIVVIGTTLQFPYLRYFIDKAKRYGGKVIHVNPDPNYQGVNPKEYLCKHISDLSKMIDGLNNVEY